MSSSSDPIAEFLRVNSAIVACERCPRLREWCQRVAIERRAAYRDQKYWGLPVPNFGDPMADRLILGLAPAAHGANRTGRMFTGDRSGEWLYRALHRVGVANQPTFESADDGLTLSGVLITASAHCAPPENKPLPEELAACEVHLRATLALRPWRAYLCLGGIAWARLHRVLGVPAPRFGHGATHPLASGAVIVGSYHPSQQNTFTGRLTESMLDEVLRTFLRAGEP